MKTMYRSVFFLIFIFLYGCAQHPYIGLDNYGVSIVGKWKEKTKYPTILDIRSDGTFTEHFPYTGGCFVFDPRHGKWKVEGNLLKLTYGDDDSAYIYVIEKLWDKGVLFRYPNPQYTGTYKRIK